MNLCTYQYTLLSYLIVMICTILKCLLHALDSAGRIVTLLDNRTLRRRGVSRSVHVLPVEFIGIGLSNALQVVWWAYSSSTPPCTQVHVAYACRRTACNAAGTRADWPSCSASSEIK